METRTERGRASSTRVRTGHYVVVTPVRDEAHYIEGIVASVLGQTVTPDEWVIVDDGSRDATAHVARRVLAGVEWAHVVSRPDRGARVAGTGVMEAFQDGLAALRADDWEFVVKLDGDVALPPDYFERCLAAFALEPRLGIAGGVFHRPSGMGTVEERHPRFHVRGVSKIYRRACFDDIGGLVRAPGWDTLDEVTANHLGWRTQTLPHVVALHRRATGAVAGPWRNGLKNGRAAYLVGYAPSFLAVRVVREAFAGPVGAAGLGWGYALGTLRREPRIAGPELVRFVRREQRRRLLARPSIWR